MYTCIYVCMYPYLVPWIGCPPWQLSLMYRPYGAHFENSCDPVCTDPMWASWKLGGKRILQNVATGCGIILPTRQTHFWDCFSRHFLDHHLDFRPSLHFDGPIDLAWWLPSSHHIRTCRRLIRLQLGQSGFLEPRT